MHGRTERTPEKEAEFLENLGETANVTASCKATGIARSTAYEWRDDSESFRKAWDTAVERGTDALEDEATRRAKDGVTKPVHYKGERVDEVQEYSDTLLMFLLKGRRPDKFRERHDVAVSGSIAVNINLG